MTTKEIVTLAHNAVVAKLKDPSREVKLEVQRVLSYKVAGAEQTIQFKTTGWDGRSSFLDFRAGVFPAGFVHLVTAHLTRLGYRVNVVKKALPEPLGPVTPTVDAFPPDPRYDYQMEIVERLLKHGKIIAQVATGGGKSRIAKLTYARINRPTLFLTTRSLLMYQMRDAFEKDMKVPVSVLGDGQFGHTRADGTQAIKKMSVGMVQTLISRLQEKTLEGEFEAVYDSIIAKEQQVAAAFAKAVEAKHRGDKAKIKALIGAFATKQEKERISAEEIKKIAEKRVKAQNAIREQTINLLSKFECVILEEAHEASGNSYYDILKHCINAHYRLALTATPFMKDDEEANMRLMACSGPIGMRVSEKTLIDRGILAKPFFKYVTLKDRPRKLYKSTPWQAAYRIGVVECQERNESIVQEAVKGRARGLSVMCLIQHTKHGQELRSMMRKAGLRADFISGESDHETRKEALTALANGDIDVLIGSTILDVGVDVPAVGMVILAGGGKAEVALRQRIGRGLRAKKKGPNIAFVVDYADIFNDHLRAHYLTRRAIVNGTPGFAENIIPDGSEFEFDKLGFPLI